MKKLMSRKVKPVVPLSYGDMSKAIKNHKRWHQEQAADWNDATTRAKKTLQTFREQRQHGYLIEATTILRMERLLAIAEKNKAHYESMYDKLNQFSKQIDRIQSEASVIKNFQLLNDSVQEDDYQNDHDIQRQFKRMMYESQALLELQT